MANRRATQFPGAMPEEIAFAKRRTDAKRASLRLDGAFVLAALISLLLLVPAAVVGWSVGKVGGAAGFAMAVVAGSLVSVVLTFLAARAWLQFAPGDKLFADATLTGWVRRGRAERQVAAVREVFDDPEVASIELHVDRLIGISKAVEARDARTHRHSSRVAIHAMAAAKHLGLEPDETARLRAAAKLHDIGALNEPVWLDPTEDERLALALAGADLVSFTGDEKLIAALRHQHENFDGSGVPAGLTGQAIPLAARVIAVADAFDTISRERGQTAALAELNAGAGTQFDPEVVKAFNTDAQASPISALRGAVAGVAPKASAAATDLLRGSASVAAAASIATGAVIATGVAGPPPTDRSSSASGDKAAAVSSTPVSNSIDSQRELAADKRDKGSTKDGDSKSPSSENNAVDKSPSSSQSQGRDDEAAKQDDDSSSSNTTHREETLSAPDVPVEELSNDLGETVNNTTGTVEQVVTEVVDTVTETTQQTVETVEQVVGGLGGQKK